jgi:hypothetical protein
MHDAIFSTHIAAGEFDPTGDVVSQLEALHITQPCSIPNFQALSLFVEEQLKRATYRDDKLRKKGFKSVE